MAQFIHIIRLEFRSKLVLHNHHELAEDFGISRIHFSEKNRRNIFSISSDQKILSTSTHSMEDFNSLKNDFDYAFLSPVFKSISKENYHPKINLFEALKSKTNNHTKVIALGGIDTKNIDSIILYQPGIAYYYKSEAAIEISRNLSGVIYLGTLLAIFPKSIANYIYDYVASNRYKWYGKRESCFVPTAELNLKFL